MIRLLRHCIDQGLTQGGTLAGLADKRLAKALLAIHENSARAWTLSDMAALAGMSRARFAIHFRETTGETPADYLVSWRLMHAQRLLKRGLQLKHVAYDVSYCTAAHSMLADKKSGVPKDVLQAIRAQQPIPDAKLAALAAMAVEMVAKHGQRIMR